jgi:hypothetical protein
MFGFLAKNDSASFREVVGRDDLHEVLEHEGGESAVHLCRGSR